jgi:hypothetical protein
MVYTTFCLPVHLSVSPRVNFSFWGAHTVFQSIAPLHILTNSAQGFQFLHVLTDTCHFLGFLTVALLKGRTDHISLWL